MGSEEGEKQPEIKLEQEAQPGGHPLKLLADSPSKSQSFEALQESLSDLIQGGKGSL
jgi:hypothetical protein